MKSLADALLWIWQLPQNLIGLVMSLIFHVHGSGSCVMNDGSLRRFHYWPYTSAVSLGCYRFVNRNAGMNTAYHEYGHSMQSMYLGPLYLLVIGIPSAVWCIVHSHVSYIYFRWSYYAFYTEFWADDLGGVKR